MSTLYLFLSCTIMIKDSNKPQIPKFKWLAPKITTNNCKSCDRPPISADDGG